MPNWSISVTGERSSLQLRGNFECSVFEKYTNGHTRFEPRAVLLVFTLV
jgi:hypothetical protein